MRHFICYKLYFIVTLLSFFSVHQVSFCQKYKKTYNQIINYSTQGQNGKDVQVDFACQYDLFLGDPILKSRSKLISEGEFVIYEGVKYYRSEIGNEIFDKIEIGRINVSFDIYQGGNKITTVTLYNEISVSLIPTGQWWGTMWPGVSAEEVKDIWREGYTIKNARLVDVSFSGFHYLRSYLNNKEKERERILEEEQKRREDEERRIREEQERIEQERREREEAERLERESRESTEKERMQEELRMREEAAEQERRRIEEEERQKNQKISEYRERIESQRKENNELASSAAASSTGMLFLFGGIIYDNMGVPAKNLFSGSNFHLNFDVGFGGSLFPIARNSVKTGISTFTGNLFTTENNDPTYAFTIDLRLLLRIGYEMKNGGVNLYGRFEPGFSPIFTDFNSSFGYGAEVYLGHKNIKAYGSYSLGRHNFTTNNWLDPEEIGDGGMSNTKYRQLRGGFKVSFYGNSKTAKRNHLIFGIIENYFDRNSASVFGFRENPDRAIFNLLKTPSNLEQNPFIATGYFFEWKHDHTHRLYVEVFLNYPATGEIGERSSEGMLFIQAGFLRSIEGFFGKQ